MDYYHNIVYIMAGLIVLGYVLYHLYAKFKPYIANG